VGEGVDESSGEGVGEATETVELVVHAARARATNAVMFTRAWREGLIWGILCRAEWEVQK
jgi:hypothetical protein